MALNIADQTGRILRNFGTVLAGISGWLKAEDNMIILLKDLEGPSQSLRDLRHALSR
jgi:hypothetical protein